MAPQLLPSRLHPTRPSSAGRAPAATGALLGGLLLAVVAMPAAGLARPQCRFLMPIGGSGEPTVQKRISGGRLVGRTNWNTDFAVDRSYRSYRVNFQSVSTDRGSFPLAVFLRFTDGSNLQVVNDTLTLDPQQARRLGPFSAVPGKRTSLVNVRVGSSAMPKATGFSYRVSVEGCE
jgi:hypothetical protein